jgi:hypothetical protein
MWTPNACARHDHFQIVFWRWLVASTHRISKTWVTRMPVYLFVIASSILVSSTLSIQDGYLQNGCAVFPYNSGSGHITKGLLWLLRHLPIVFMPSEAELSHCWYQDISDRQIFLSFLPAQPSSPLLVSHSLSQARCRIVLYSSSGGRNGLVTGIMRDLGLNDEFPGRIQLNGRPTMQLLYRK